jgi:hypothetical protein
MAAAAFALHQLRYLVAPVAGSEPSEHAYIPIAAGVVVLLFAVAAGELALRVAGARDDGTAEAEPRAFWVVWLVSSVGLTAIFAGQELAEALLAGGPVLDPLAGGGLWVLPLALVLGGLVALALRLAGVAVLGAVRRQARRRGRPGAVPRPRWRPAGPAASVLARNLAGRAPPLTS